MFIVVVIVINMTRLDIVVDSVSGTSILLFVIVTTERLLCHCDVV